MTENEFANLADRTLARIGSALDGGGTDVDWSLVDGILTIECEDGSKLIVNRHLANREIWVAAKSGGFHFRVDGEEWRDTRGGDELGTTIARLLQQQAGVTLEPPPLPTR